MDWGLLGAFAGWGDVGFFVWGVVADCVDVLYALAVIGWGSLGELSGDFVFLSGFVGRVHKIEKIGFNELMRIMLGAVVGGLPGVGLGLAAEGDEDFLLPLEP